MTARACSLPECGRKLVARGLCHFHWQRWRTGLEPSLTPVCERRPFGAGTINKRGYVTTRRLGTRRLDHDAIAEEVLGRPLRKGEVVHHVNGDPGDNRNENLVVCDSSYHTLIHARMRARDACGNPAWRKCLYCQTYRPIEEMRFDRSNRNWMHRSCSSKYRIARKKARRTQAVSA